MKKLTRYIVTDRKARHVPYEEYDPTESVR